MAAPSSNSFHLRSASLLSTSHSSIAQVEECLHLFKGSADASILKRRHCSSVKNGINHLKDLHLSTIDFLRLPPLQQSLRGEEILVSELLEAFVGLLDVFEMLLYNISRTDMGRQEAWQPCVDVEHVYTGRRRGGMGIDAIAWLTIHRWSKHQIKALTK
ncbi:hypothetical protein EJ110_NYTH00852 [Nymphaea thermarum]|nr:hypothetical protein EJ110_NYTH00852 [Nymphaea thermarum]